MNGPEHYREAERLMEVAQQELRGYAGSDDSRGETYHLHHSAWAQRQAQAHATLALAAATAANLATAWDGDEDHSRTRTWSAAIS